MGTSVRPASFCLPALSAHQVELSSLALLDKMETGQAMGLGPGWVSALSSVTITKQQPSWETQFSHNGTLHSLSKYGSSIYCVLETQLKQDGQIHPHVGAIFVTWEVELLPGDEKLL